MQPDYKCLEVESLQLMIQELEHKKLDKKEVYVQGSCSSMNKNDSDS